MKILFIGGTGIISSACSDALLRAGHELTLMVRGRSPRPIPEGAETVTADIRQPDTVRRALGTRTFDVVVNWIAFTPDHIETDLALFSGRTAQYVFISSASAYQTPPRRLPVTESTTLSNPIWEYSRNKIACEERLVAEFRANGFPFTVVRPSHTYDKTLLPPHGGWTVVERMRAGKPVIVHGDGASLWTLTHHRDFAVGFNGLLGHPAAIGDCFHVTGDEALTWDQIHHLLAAAAGTTARLVHVPSDVIARFDPEWGDSLLGDKTHSMLFDNTKVKTLVPDFRTRISFAQGAREIVAHHDADPARRTVDAAFDALCDRLASLMDGLRP